MILRHLLPILAALAAIPAQGWAEQRFADLGTCALEAGGVIEDCRIGYRTFGTLAEDGGNAILVPTWYTGTSEEHAFLIEDGAIDAGRFFVVVVDAIGNGVSISPSNSEAQPGEDFPGITIGDMVESQHRLLTEELGIERLYAVAGLSMGGMQAFEWSVRYPGFSEKTVAAIGSPQLPAYDIIRWEAQIALLELWRRCRCGEAAKALWAQRMTAQVPSFVSEQVTRENVSALIEEGVASIALSEGETWNDTRQAEAMIAHDIADGFAGDLATAAEATDTSFFIITSADDRVVTPGPALSFARMVGARTLELDADCGHGDPWCDAETFSAEVRDFLGRP